ncbi:uncharacterized protein LOC125178634 [Hyalella azteca]|uniref:Uncharacterized protein LOC125178634 n=1 Tax=Hyalella azteca TaxID=294128 RepID=A0A979FRL8_HYAAZ|nr:uncharacterized protein LOC125178634 [Hyalella azteca]
MLEVIHPPQLKSPKMVAAVASSCYRFKPSRSVVKQKKELFERGFSDSCLLAKSCKIHRGRSADSFRSKSLNEAQRLVKYRSSSSLASLDSGVSSRGGSANASCEDLHCAARQAPSGDRTKLRTDNRRQHLRVTSFSLPRSPLPEDSSSPVKSPCAYGLLSSATTSSSPNLCLSDHLPPPVPPKSRPPLPPRRRIDSPIPPSSQTSSVFGDADSESSSDLYFPEFLCDDRSTSALLRSAIPPAFFFKDSVLRFLLDVGHSAGNDVLIEKIAGETPGRFSLTAAIPSVQPEERTELQVLFRTGGLARLEEQRDAVLAGTITRLQAHARGVLARRRLQKRKVQETAIRCIQKNVRKFMGVREWPWWRLLVRLTPLLDVHRTEHQLREAKTELETRSWRRANANVVLGVVQTELETLRARLEKVEREKSGLQQSNDTLEARLTW